MLAGKRIAVVMPAYRAERTLRRTYDAVPHDIVDEVILTDDASCDGTAALARSLGIRTLVHESNRGYGGNQKTCYAEAVKRGADVVVMLHPDYQYDSRVIPYMIQPILDGHADFVLGSRIIGEGALAGGMPLYKFLANRFLTTVENLVLNRKFSDLHTGFRAYSRRLLCDIPFVLNSDNFVFDSQVIAQVNYRGYVTTEVPIPTRYFAEASSVNFVTSTIYGFSTLYVMSQLALQKMGIRRYAWLERRLEDVISRPYAAKIFPAGGKKRPGGPSRDKHV